MKRLIAALAIAVSGCSFGDSTSADDASTVVAGDGTNVQVIMQTSMGELTIDLHEEKAPITVENFLKYVDDGFYEGLIIHRIVPNFVVQGGGYDVELNYVQPTYDGIKNESDNGLANSRGTLSMARTSAPDSANSQFFINLVDNANLDGSSGRPGYAVFATVVEGMEIVDAMARVPTKNVAQLPGMPTPAEPIVIESIRRISE